MLERPCPECGFDAQRVDARADIAAMVRHQADAWRAVLARTDVAQRPRADVWSPLEYACHVRDVFTLFDTRLHLMLDEHDPLFANWDQDATAVEQRYGEQQPDRVALELTRRGNHDRGVIRRGAGRRLVAPWPPERRRVVHRRFVRALLHPRPDPPPARRRRRRRLALQRGLDLVVHLLRGGTRVGQRCAPCARRSSTSLPMRIASPGVAMRDWSSRLAPASRMPGTIVTNVGRPASPRWPRAHCTPRRQGRRRSPPGGAG